MTYCIEALASESDATVGVIIDNSTTPSTWGKSELIFVSPTCEGGKITLLIRAISLGGKVAEALAKGSIVGMIHVHISI